MQKSRLRKIIKENHGHQISSIAFNYHQKLNQNLIATVGHVQCNIYDNSHLGANLDLMLHFVNENKQKKNTNLELLFCEWIGKKNEEEDALLAMGAQDGSISIMSIANTRVVSVLHEHTRPIVDLKSHKNWDQKLLSCASDGKIIFWDVENKTKLHTFHSMALSLAINPAGDQFLSGCQSGLVRRWKLPSFPSSSSVSPSTSTVEPPALQIELHGGEGIDGIEYVSDQQVLSKGRDGKLVCWTSHWGTSKSEQTAKESTKGRGRGAKREREDEKQQTEPQKKAKLELNEANGDSEELKQTKSEEVDHKENKTKEEKLMKGPKCVSKFSVSSDKQYVATGTNGGVIVVYHIKSGEVEHRFEHKKIKNSSHSLSVFT